ncbi:uncharacterized protein M6B38_383665 [Iris pallida]|uniref:Uncharacterized protein n=1 Tax=Iris pallida TaxID=29817 RepID=A0AAX6G3W8_IRIPA|nr:uncharacterized protein M6B38_383665 [Iris pallida]
MLSTESPAETPCSSTAPPPPPKAADERASDRLPFPEADPAVGLLAHTQQQTPNFSLREYVFASRRGGVETNWPFRRKLLRLCSKHGVRDPLPPFEPPKLVRSRCRRDEVGSEAGRAVAGQVGLHESRDRVCSSCVEPVPLLPSDVVSDAGRVIGDAETPSTVMSRDRIGLEFARRQPPPQEKLETSQELSGKKCKLVLKVSAASQSKRPEDIASTSSTVSDPMASKICPVCKQFSSSSMTTLNAHMDQCLRVESNTTRLDMAKPSSLKPKPSKKRLMVDIYATAAYCTLEDLDRRNGTTWARDSSLVAPAGEPPTETKRPMLSQVDIRHDGDEAAYVEPPAETKRPRLPPTDVRRDGDESVYVDSNGIKLRILSKLSDKPPMIPWEESKRKKDVLSVPEFNEGKSVSSGKKTLSGSNFLKHMKPKPLSKKLSSFEMMPIREIQAPSAKVHCHAEARRDDEDVNLRLVAETMQSGGRATLGQWVCSKRSDLPKKKMKKAVQKCSENPNVTTKSPLSKSDQPGLSLPSGVRSHLNSSWSTEELRSPPPKTRRVDFLQDEKKGSSVASASANGLRLKVLSRSCGASTSSRRNTGEEHPNGVHRATARSSDGCHLSVKAKKIVSLKKNILVRRPSFPLEAVDGDDVDGQRAPKSFRKRRSVLVSGKRGRELALGVNGTSKKVRIRRPNFSLSTQRLFERGSNLCESEKEREEDVPMEELSHGTPEQAPLRSSSSMEKVDDDHVDRDNLVSERLSTDSATDEDPKPSGDEYAQSASESESQEERAAPRLYDKNEMQSFDHGQQETDGRTDVRVTGEAADAFGGEGESRVVVQCKESQAETASAQESSACLTSHGEVGLDVPLENSSATSGQAKSDREPSFSPGSTASTISTPSQDVYRPKVSKPEPSTRSENNGEARGRAIGMRNEEVEMILEPGQLRDGQGCCCSRREGISREFPFMRQTVVPPAAAATAVPLRGKQISGLYIAPPRLSSFVSYPGLRAESVTEFTKPSPESAADSVKFPAYGGLGSNGASSPSQPPPTPNSVLRLMGKDLMVLKEDSAQPSPSGNSVPSLGFGPARTVSNQESYWYNYSPQLQNVSSVFTQALPMASHPLPLHAGFLVKPDRQPPAKRSTASPRPPYTMKEVIVIDDSPDSEPEMPATLPPAAAAVAVSNPIAQQRQFACFPSHAQYVSGGGFRPVYPKPGPTTKELANAVVRGGEGLRPLLPNPFYFHSTSTGQLHHLGQPVYFP